MKRRTDATDRSTEELLELIRLTEQVSADIHGTASEGAVLQTVVRAFRDSKRFNAHVMLLDPEDGTLRFAATSFPPTIVRLGETIAGLSMETFRIDPARTSLVARVLHGGETIQVSTAEALADFLPSATVGTVLRRLRYEGTEDILTPLRANGRPTGILSVTAPGLADHFIPSLKSFAHHISAAFELAKALRESERAHQQYRDLVENLNEIIYTVDRDGVITYVSPNVSEIGFVPSELIGRRFTRAFEPEDAEEAQARFARFVAGERTTGVGEYRLRAKDGSTHWIRISSRIAMEDGELAGLRGSIVDVTQAKQAEEALLESERILNQTGRMARIGGWEHDLESGEAVWTRELYDIIEIDPSEPPPGVREHLGFYPPADRTILERAYDLAVSTGQPFDLELQVSTAKGRLIWCRAYGEPVFESGRCVKMRGTFQDIGDLKRMQRAHDESERRLAMLMGNLPGMAYRCRNEPDWTMEFVSEGCRDLTGYSPDELVANRVLSYGSIIDSEDRGTVWQKVQRALGERESFAIEYRILTADGVQKWVWEQGQGVFLETGEVAALEGFIADITQQKEAAATLREVLDGTIVAIARTVELRDPYTAGHQERVALLACAIAREMGHLVPLGHTLRVAGLLHDVGKISVPSEILSKPTKLSEAEMKLVQSHAEASYEILKDISFPWPIADIVGQHHERLDGSGYFRGLRGDDICLGARILAVADVVEAIASHRPYRPALGVEVALEEIERGRDRLFDADVVDACLRLFRVRNLSFETLSDDVCLPESPPQSTDASVHN